MNKLVKTTAVSLVALSLGVSSLPTTTLPALAKTKAAKVLSTKKLKKTAYHAKGGYIYANKKLTKKAHKAFKYLKTTFYATKSVKLKKRNGKTATYYYVKNKRGNVKGWIWKGNLKKVNTKALARRKSDIKHVLAAVRSMSSGDQTDALDNFQDVTTSNAYSSIGLPYVIQQIYGYTAKDGQATIQATASFKGRFSSVTNAKLAAMSDQLAETIAASDDPSNDFDIREASNNLAGTLADAVATLD